MPFHHLEAKGVFEIAAGFATSNNNNNNISKWTSEELLFSFANNNCITNEPTSVLHMRRSPSPPTSASTLSSSFGGGGGDTVGGGGVATVLPPETPAGPTTKDEWASELQPIPERCGGLVIGGMEDWETMLSETAAAVAAASSPGGPQDHSLLRWIAGDVVVDDPSFGLKQLLQNGSIHNTTNNNPLDFDGNAGFGILDFDPNLGYSVSGYANGNNNGGKIIGSSIAPPTSSSGPLNYNNKVTQNPILSSSAISNALPLPVSLHPGMIYPPQPFESPDEKPQILNPQLLGHNPSFLLPMEQPQAKRHNSGGVMAVEPPAAAASQIPKVPFCDPGHEFLMMRKQQQQQQQQHLGSFVPHPHPHPQGMMMMQSLPKQQELPQQQQALLDQLYKAAELVGTGTFSHAQGILARLNHHLSSPIGKPLHRAAFYFKEALQLLFINGNGNGNGNSNSNSNNSNNNNHNNSVSFPPLRCPTPFDVIFKMGAYKVFSEFSPLIQFVNFTSNQALLETLCDSPNIHIVDFDIGFGAQWASFMQELNRGGGGPTPSLKITAFASPSTHHHVELALMRDNLAQFAAEIGVAFDLEVVNFDSLEQTSYSMPVFRSEGEVVAVNFPISAASNQPAALPNLLRFIKQLSPKIVVSQDRGCDRSDLPFPQHILQALHSYINLLESLDAAVNMTPDAVNKIEKFLLQPKIENTVLGRLRALAPDKMPHWKTVFASAGYLPVTFSNFAETQAECVVKRTPVRGFHIEKRQASLALCWQHRELVSVSAWRCC